MLNTPKTTFNLLLGTRDDGVRTCCLEIWAGTHLLRITDHETVQSFILACIESQNYLTDIGQQCHAHMHPSTAPSIFTSYEEEAAEIAAWAALKEAKDSFPRAPRITAGEIEAIASGPGGKEYLKNMEKP